jgi:hypothetical protein
MNQIDSLKQNQEIEKDHSAYSKLTNEPFVQNNDKQSDIFQFLTPLENERNLPKMDFQVDRSEELNVNTGTGNDDQSFFDFSKPHPLDEKTGDRFSETSHQSMSESAQSRFYLSNNFRYTKLNINELLNDSQNNTLKPNYLYKLTNGRVKKSLTMNNLGPQDMDKSIVASISNFHEGLDFEMDKEANILSLSSKVNDQDMVETLELAYEEAQITIHQLNQDLHNLQTELNTANDNITMIEQNNSSKMNQLLNNNRANIKKLNQAIKNKSLQLQKSEK